MIRTVIENFEFCAFCVTFYGVALAVERASLLHNTLRVSGFGLFNVLCTMYCILTV